MRTVVLQAAGAGRDEVYRHLGVSDTLCLAQLRRVLDLSLGFFPAAAPATAREAGARRAGPRRGSASPQVPQLAAAQPAWWFSRDGVPVDAGVPVHRVLQADGAELTYHWGLWLVAVGVVSSFPREAGSPPAVCVGGSGSFSRDPFDADRINALLAAELPAEVD
ncbi:hypothetical protein CATYP_00440 [Corynebacterium atypicum]|uniref:Uncharacterized protein n=1 Tax=Corynebacterium atypicum TaxID=191610 RepID=A0ABM5QKW5_9CORY|nr:hypothetical protein CATYP_00440 [Corynebacterium atypicum]